MILTLNLNASLDKIYTVDKLEYGGVVRAKIVQNTAGGKGLHVANICKELNENYLATGFLGGKIGEYLQNKLTQNHINHDFISIKNETRTCINITTPDGKQTEILEPGPSINKEEVLIKDARINENYLSVVNSQDAKLGSGIGLVNSSRQALKSTLEFSGAELLDITNTLSLVGQESLSVNEIQLKLANLNLSKNTFGTIEISEGVIFLKDNDNKFIVGKLQTANFKNEQGLDPQGDNLYQTSSESGKALYAGKLNKLVSNSLELSTANLGNSLTSLLVYQKAFEANSKSITTSDEMLKTAIELKK